MKLLPEVSERGIKFPKAVIVLSAVWACVVIGGAGAVIAVAVHFVSKWW